MYDDKATDFSAQITKVKALPTQPDFYYVAAMPYNVGPVVKQFRDAGLTAPIVGGDGYDTPDLVTTAGAAADNVFFSTHALMDATNGTDGIKTFITAYTAEYGHAPENAFAALGYDSVYLLADAIKRAGGMDGAGTQERHRDHVRLPGHHRLDHVHAGEPRAPEGRDHHRRQGRQVHARRGRRGAHVRPRTLT